MTKRYRIDIKSAGEISTGLTPLSEHASGVPGRLGPPEADSEAKPLTGLLTADRVRLYADEFVGVFRNFSGTAESRRMAAQITPDSMHRYAYVHWLFRDGTRFRRFLSDATVSGTATCTATLFLLNIVLWNYLTSLRSGFDHFSSRIRKAMIDGALDQGGCVDPFLWSLIVDPRNVVMADLENVWLLSRLLWIEKRLNGGLRDKLRAALLQFLSAEDEGVETRMWSPAQLRAAVYHDLGLNIEV